MNSQRSTFNFQRSTANRERGEGEAREADSESESESEGGEGGWMQIDQIGLAAHFAFMATSSLPQTSGLSESLTVLRALRPELARRGVANLWLFGSRARQTGRSESDWDLLVEFNKPPDLVSYMDLKFWLEGKLGGSVDLVSRSACKPRFLAAIQPELLDVA